MILQSILIGIVLGSLELVILSSSRQKLGFWVYAQSIVFWFTCGFMIGNVDSSLPPYLHGAMLAVLLNLPWYINISIIPKQYGHLVPRVVASVLLGAIGGAVKMILTSLFDRFFLFL